MWKWLKSKDVKYLNYWLQAYLLNVKEIHIGYKNKDGIVDEPIELNYVRDLPTVNKLLLIILRQLKIIIFWFLFLESFLEARNLHRIFI